MPLTEQDVKLLIKLGSERNILIFDNHASYGIPTTRLLCLMKTGAKLYHPDKKSNCVNAIIVDGEFLGEFIVNPNALSSIRDKVAEETETLHGLKVYVYDHDKFTSLTQDYFRKELGGMLQSADEKLIIMFNDNEEPTLDNVLLGSY